jgi:hypothetical protein
MRPGPLEIVLIIVVVICIALIARIVRPAGRSSAAHDERKSPQRAGGFLNKAGIALIIGGIVVLAAAASLFRWVLQSYLWAIILIAGGTIMVLLARRKR